MEKYLAIKVLGEFFKDNKDFKITEVEEDYMCDGVDAFMVDLGVEEAGYIVVTDEEANNIVTGRISEGLWAFNSEFIVDECELDSSGIARDSLVSSLKSIQEDNCEDANGFLYALIDRLCGINKFVEDAVKADGRGHFIADWDGVENTVKYNGMTYYLYRIN